MALRRLVLVRHAKSSWEDPSLPDMDRPLNERGKADAPRMGRRLADVGVMPGVMLSSPAKRAFKTAQKIARELGHQAILVDPRIYDAPSSRLLKVVRELPDKFQEAMLFGHNPGISELARRLCPGFTCEMTTCVAVCLNFDVLSWASIKDGTAKLAFHMSPKDKDAAG